jgi:hypothetical protein
MQDFTINTRDWVPPPSKMCQIEVVIDTDNREREKTDAP